MNSCEIGVRIDVRTCLLAVEIPRAVEVVKHHIKPINRLLEFFDVEVRKILVT